MQGILHPICNVSDIPQPGCKEFTLPLEHQVLEGFIVHWRDNFFAYRNACPHQGVTLNWAPDQFFDVELRYLQCGLHGALFEPQDGFCVYGPCLGSRLQHLKVHIHGQRVLVQLPET